MGTRVSAATVARQKPFSPRGRRWKGKMGTLTTFQGGGLVDCTPSVRQINQGQSASVKILGCCAAAQDLAFSNSTGVR
jgi:hypothetical protein